MSLSAYGVRKCDHIAARKLPRDGGSFSTNKLFLSGHLSLVCGSHDRQHVSSFLHKLNVLMTHVVFSVEHSFGAEQTSVTEGGAYPRSVACGSRSSLKVRVEAQSTEAAGSYHGSDLVRKSPAPPFDLCSPTLGINTLASWLADGPSVCLPTDKSASTCPSKSVGSASWYVSWIWCFSWMRVRRKYRSEWINSHSLRAVCGTPGRKLLSLTFDWGYLVNSGLLSEVTETLLDARAPSTRRLYFPKWQIFALLRREHN